MGARFRKVFIVCEDNKIFSDLTQVPIYKTRDHAEFICNRAKLKAEESVTQYSEANKKPKKFKVHAFYLVHEDSFRD